MNFLEACRLAADSVLSNKLRSVLTLLGIVIGVAAVIVMVSLGDGARTSVTREIQSTGANLLWVQPDWHNQEVQRGNFKNLKLEDADDLLAECPALLRVAPEGIGSGTIGYQGVHYDASLAGTSESFIQMRNLNLSAGRFLSDIDTQLGRNVAVLGYELAVKLFGPLEPLGQRIKIRGVTFTVIGVMEDKKEGFGDNSVGNMMVFIPIRTYARITGMDNVPVIFAQAKSERLVNTAKGQMESYMVRRYGEKNKYAVSTQESTLKMFGNVLSILTAVLGGVAGVSLLVGGIGVMNIMLVSVTERTREIGIRKALGATYQDILRQFVVESIVLCALGGVGGILLGVGGSALISAAAPLVKTTVTGSTILLAVLSTTLIGVGFGVFPASKAARLDPIEALRYE